jgi:hypothetical protein
VTSAGGFIFVQPSFEYPLNRKQNYIHLATYSGGSLLLNEDKKPSSMTPGDGFFFAY